jgi:hypothetical protein
LDEDREKNSKLVGVILTKFLKPASSFTFKSAKRLSPYLIPSLRMCLVHHHLCHCLPFNRNMCPLHIPVTQHVDLKWLISGMSGHETVFVGVYKP